jgi:hypothetical protein
LHQLGEHAVCLDQIQLFLIFNNQPPLPASRIN